MPIKSKNFTLLLAAAGAFFFVQVPAHACGNYSFIQWPSGQCTNLDWLTERSQDQPVAPQPATRPDPLTISPVKSRPQPRFEPVQVFPAQGSGGFQVQAIVKATNPTNKKMAVDVVFQLGNAKRAEKFVLGPNDTRPLQLRFSFVDGDRRVYSPEEIRWTVRNP